MVRPALLAAALVWLLPALARGEEGGITALDLPRSVEVLNYELVGKQPGDLPKPNPEFWSSKTMSQKLRDLRMNRAAEVVNEVEVKHENRKQPGRHFMPALCGATGLIDVPVAYTIPKRRWVASAQTEHVVGNSKYWPLPYRYVGESNRYFTLNYGATDNIEVNADVEMWNKDFQYNDFINGTDPKFATHDQFFLGFGSKWAFPLQHPGLERIWFATGFRVQFYENDDRSVTDFHEYERFQNIYFVFSAKGTEELFGHLMFKYVSYDWRGGIPPAGATDLFPGYSPVNAWGQWGIAFEWFVFPDLEIYTELHKDTNVEFFYGENREDGTLLQFNWNVGARYQYKDLGVGFWAKRINFAGLDDNGVQVSFKF